MRAWFSRLIAVTLLLTVSAGCRHTPGPAASGTSDYRFVEPPPAAPSTGSAEVAAEPAKRLQFREARPIEPLIMPAYPARALAAKAGATTVGVHVTLDEHGVITDIRASIWVVSFPGPFSEDFRAAVDAALRQWRFEPAETVELEQEEKEGSSPLRVLKREKVATEFDVAFDFAPGGGTARVPGVR
jgi:hypothetical protein